MVVKKFDHRAVEKKWQEIWEKEALYTPKLGNPEKKFYNLWMFPYPSAEGLHAGHAYASTGSDVFGRFKRMNGFNVFQPIGYDSFGIHSENYAMKINDHPAKMIARTTKHYEAQMRSLGHAYDWTRTVTTSDSDYYKWTQWIFIEMFKAGLAYKKKAKVNWCPSCKTVLADEQVVTPSAAGKEPKNAKGEVVPVSEGMEVCERCGTLIERKELEQWFFRITEYAEKLLEGLDTINWTEKVKTAQRNWIGKKDWIDIRYPIDGINEEIVVSTTRPDTNFGATFIVISPEHPFVERIIRGEVKVGEEVKNNISNYVNVSKSKSDAERIAEGKKKTGVFTNIYAINRLNDYKMPIYVADFVLMSVGTGVVVGVPGHDRRDFEFAKEFNLPVKRVVVGNDADNSEINSIEKVMEDDGKVVNSGFLDGLDTNDALKKVMDYLEEKYWGKRTTRYHLRDWLISRQRYWGPPIPMIYCEHCAQEGKSFFSDKESEVGEEVCGWYPVPESDLPITLPEIKDFKPEGSGKGPLANHPEFYKTKCPGCGKEAVRETDVSDTFLDSAWYFLRYPSVGSEDAGKTPWNTEITGNWLPVDLYFGGAEHAVLHLMYSRFVWKMLVDRGFVDKKLGYEPFPWFYAHGLMIKDGAKMSKSRGNVVNPDEYIEKYGADTLRLYLMFMGPMDGYPDFRDTGIEGMRKFVERIWSLFADMGSKPKSQSPQLDIKMHQTVKKVTEDIGQFKYNTAISAIMEYVNVLKAQPKGEVDKQYLTALTLLLAPFTPHLAEELWKVTGNKDSVHVQSWPVYNPDRTMEDTISVPVQVNGKLRGIVTLERGKEKDKEYISNMAKNDTKVSKWLEGKEIKKEIYIEGRLLNLVI
jgi:leucyl-tRNA synthetase